MKSMGDHKYYFFTKNGGMVKWCAKGGRWSNFLKTKNRIWCKNGYMGGRCDATHLSILGLYYFTKSFHSSLFSICFTCIFYRCMEATPSLACANKCVFCWRHHTNPVGKNWQWKMDDPLVIVNTAIDLHTKMIKQMKGVPGMFNKLFQSTTWYFNQIFQFLMSLCSTRCILYT